MSAPEQGGLSKEERDLVIDTGRHVYGCCADDCEYHGLPEDAQIKAVETILATRLATVPAADAELRAAVEGLVGNETARLAMRNAMLAKLGDVGMDAALATAAAYVAQEALRSLLAGRGDV